MVKIQLKIIFFVFIISVMFLSACSAPNLNKAKPAANFTECAQKYAVMESYPRQCRIPDGTVFVELLTPAEKKKTEPPASLCKNLCGDGECQSVVCLSTDCICAETKDNCPQDCPEATSAKQSESKQLLGGDKDEHGCIGSAGYSWCAEKNKCLRTWEEPCPDSSVAVELKKLFASNHNKKAEDIKIVIEKETADYIRGSVNLSAGEGGGGYFFAAKINGAWQIVLEGNGGINCNLKTRYGFPDDMMADCYNE